MTCVSAGADAGAHRGSLANFALDRSLTKPGDATHSAYLFSERRSRRKKKDGVVVLAAEAKKTESSLLHVHFLGGATLVQPTATCASESTT